MSPERLRRFFLRGTGTQEGYVAVRPELKEMVEFQRINLLDASYGRERARSTSFSAATS
jgi:chemotaxis protein methyltransferase CheR